MLLEHDRNDTCNFSHRSSNDTYFSCSSVQVRTPMIKRVIFNEAATVEAEMVQKTNKSRTGGTKLFA